MVVSFDTARRTSEILANIENQQGLTLALTISMPNTVLHIAIDVVVLKTLIYSELNNSNFLIGHQHHHQRALISCASSLTTLSFSSEIEERPKLQ